MASPLFYPGIHKNLGLPPAIIRRSLNAVVKISAANISQYKGDTRGTEPVCSGD